MPLRSEIRKEYKCINCGEPASRLYQDYSNGIVKVEHCERCGGLVDKYIEYDPVVICLDALLLKMQAFRHVLYNSQTQSHLKLTVILLICDAFMKLMFERRQADQSFIMPEYVIYSALEWRLYWNCLLAAIELSVYLLFMVCVNQVNCWRIPNTEKKQVPSAACLVRAILLSNFGKVLVIPAVIWGNHHGYLVFWLSQAFVSSSNVQAVRAISTKQSCTSIAMAVLIGQAVSMATASMVNTAVMMNRSLYRSVI